MTGTVTEPAEDVVQDEVNELEGALSGEVDEVVDEKEEVVAPAPEVGKKAEEPTGKIEEPAVEEPTKDTDLASENAELRQTLREQRRQLAILNAKVNRSLKKQEVEEEEDEDEPATGKTQEDLAGIEKYQSEIEQIAATRGDSFDEMVELMSLNPKFEDVREVCTRSRFDDIFEAAASEKVAKEGGDQLEAQLALEASVWKMANPYRYMYDIIKKYHPDFRKQEGGEKTEPAKPTAKVQGVEPTKEAVERGKTPAKSPASVMDVGGGGDAGRSGWTAARIDALDESELDRVPTDVYDKYLRGELD